MIKTLAPQKSNSSPEIIYELTKEGEQGEKIGYFKNGDVVFYADEK